MKLDKKQWVRQERVAPTRDQTDPAQLWNQLTLAQRQRMFVAFATICHKLMSRVMLRTNPKVMSDERS